MMLKTPATFLCIPFAALIFLQGSSCKSSGVQKNSASTQNSVQRNESPAQRKESKPSPSRASQSPSRRALAPGVWGGQHISLEVTPSGAAIEYDCAHGSISEQIVPDGKGMFVVKGFHAKEHGGPVRQEDEENGKPATYHGSIDGETMTLTVILSGTKESAGTFTLTRGQVARLRKCK